jgi:hypothetical protein
MSAIVGKNYEKPTLDLNFAENKSLIDSHTGRNLITFSRSQSGKEATYVGSDGLIKYAGADEPRFDHDPETGECLGLLIEEQRENLLIYSDYSVNENTTDAQLEGLAIAPDGTLSARRYSVPSAGLDTINKLADPVIDGGTHTFSVWIRSTGSTSQVRTITGNPQFINEFDITTSWQRYSFTKVNNVGTGSRAYVQMINVGDEIEVWGAQLEEGTFPTSYIPTSGSTVTRNADEASITGTNFSSWYKPNETTLYIESPDFPNYSRLANGAFVYISDTNVVPISLNDGIKFGTGSPTTTNRVFVTEAGVNYAGSTSIGAQASKFAIAVATNDFNFISDGTSKGTSTSVVVPTGMDRLVISSYGPGYAHISRLTYWPKRLPDLELQQLTK